MAKLVLSLDGNVLNKYQLDKEIITIGRKPDNDIHIDNLSVSGYHAKILTILNDSFIEDLDSTNGTLICNRKVNKQVLINNVAIGIGNHELKYINTEQKRDFIQTMVIQPDDITTPGTNTTSTSSSKSPNSSSAILRLLSGENQGKEIVLSKILTTVGSPNIQVAAVSRRPAGYFLIVVDAGKENKMPMVNGIEIDKEQLLAYTDIIDVGGIKMAFLVS